MLVILFPTTSLVHSMSFPPLISPMVLLRADLSEKQTKVLFLHFLNSPGCSTPGQRLSRPGLALPWGRTSSPGSGAECRRLLPPCHALLSVCLLDLEGLSRQTFLSNKSFALSRLLLLWAFIFCGLSLPWLSHPGFFLYVYSAVTVSTLTSLCLLLVILSICLLLSPNCPQKENIQGGHISPQN